MRGCSSLVLFSCHLSLPNSRRISATDTRLEVAEDYHHVTSVISIPRRTLFKVTSAPAHLDE